MVEERAARQGPAAMCGSGMFQCSTQEKVPDTQPCYSGSERTERPVRVSMYRHLLFQQVLYKTPIARWRGGQLRREQVGVWPRASPNFFFTRRLFGGPVVQQSAAPSQVGYSRDYLFVRAIRIPLNVFGLILQLCLFSNSSHCFSLVGRTDFHLWPSYS